MHTIMCFLALVRTILSAAAYLANPDKRAAVRFGRILFLSIISLIIWFIGHRFKSVYVKLIAMNYLIIQITLAIASNSEEVSIGMIGQYFIYTLLLAPSMSYACLYLIVFFLNLAQVAHKAEGKE